MFLTFIVIAVILLGLGFSTALFAASSASEKSSNLTQVTVMLDSIEAEKLSKKSGDKIYINITESSNLGSSHTTRMPEKPILSFLKQSSEFKNLKLWQGNIRENEEIKLIFSVVEEDFSPWDIDNLIGSAQLILSKKNGKLDTKWELPIFEENTVIQVQGKSPQYLMKGEHSHYRVSFSFAESHPF